MDAVVIASHDSVHAEQVVAAVRAGKAVLCEKPLAPTLAEGRQVLRDIGATGEALLSLGFMRRFDPGYVQLRAGDRRRRRSARRCWCTTSAGASAAPRTPPRSSRSPARRSTSSTSCRGCCGRPVVEVSWVGAAPLVAGPRGAAGPAADPPADRGRRAEHLRDVPERPLRLRHPLRGRRRDRGDQPDRARPGAARRGTATRDRLRRRLAPAVRRRLPDRAAGVGRLRARRCADPARDRPRRRGRERRGRGGHHVDARRRARDEGGRR